MTKQPIAKKRRVPATSLRARSVNTFLLQMAQQDMERGQRIAELRAQKGNPPQPTVAEAVGVTLRAYQAWEAGGGIRYENVKALADYYGVDPDYILQGPREPTPDLVGALDSGRVQRLEREVVKLHAKLDLLLALARRQDPEEYSEAQQAAAEAIQDLADAFEDAPAERRKAS